MLACTFFGMILCKVCSSLKNCTDSSINNSYFRSTAMKNENWETRPRIVFKTQATQGRRKLIQPSLPLNFLNSNHKSVFESNLGKRFSAPSSPYPHSIFPNSQPHPSFWPHVRQLQRRRQSQHSIVIIRQRSDVISSASWSNCRQRAGFLFLVKTPIFG